MLFVLTPAFEKKKKIFAATASKNETRHFLCTRLEIVVMILNFLAWTDIV